MLVVRGFIFIGFHQMKGPLKSWRYYGRCNGNVLIGDDQQGTRMCSQVHSGYLHLYVPDNSCGVFTGIAGVSFAQHSRFQKLCTGVVVRAV